MAAGRCVRMLGVVSVLAFAATASGAELAAGGPTVAPEVQEAIDSGDLDDVVMALARAHTHDDRDNTLRRAERQDLLLAGDLVSWCLEVVEPAFLTLTDLGYEARLVALISFEPDDNGVIAGHHVIEVMHPEFGRWVVVDIDLGVMFDQTAISLPAGRAPVIALEPNHGDTEAASSYPLVAGGVGLRSSVFGAPVYNPAIYSPSQRAIMDEAGWVPADQPFGELFYP